MKLSELQEKYDLKLDKIVEHIKDKKAKKVLLQFPDGLKPWATSIADFIEAKSDADVRIYLGDCFGACDIPESECDLVIQFGHAPWR